MSFLPSKMASVVALAALACLGGAGVAYAPAPTFVAVALVFGVGLWLLTRSERSPRAPGVVAAEVAVVRRRGTTVDRAVSAFLLLWWVAMVAPLAAYSPREVGVGAASGSLQNQLLVAAFGLVGMLFLVPAVGRVGPAYRRLMGLWGVYMLWGYATLFWSVYPTLTVRNLVAFSLVTLGSFGLGAGFYGGRGDGGRLFLRHVTVAGVVSALVILLPLPLHLDQFNILDPGERVEISGGFTTYVARPVLIAGMALVVASFAGMRRWRGRDWTLLLLLALPVLLLKTRGPLLFALLALGLVYLIYGVRLRERVFQAGLAALAVAGLCVAYLGGLLGTVAPFLTRDDAELSLSLTGRVPLWEVLIPQMERPLTGVGFAAFWHPDRLAYMEQLVGFPVVSAHNGFLEELLNTGAIGLTLFLAFWTAAIFVALKTARRGRPLGWLAFLFLTFYLLLNLTDSLMQEYMEFPFLAAFVALGIMSVAPSFEENRPPEKTESVGRPAFPGGALRGTIVHRPRRGVVWGRR